MERNTGVNFGGKHIVRPGAYSRIDADSLSSLGGSGLRRLAILGTSVGGEPNKVHWFDNPSDARNVLIGGDLLQAGELAWSPSGDGVGAGNIGFIRVQESEKATLEKDGVVFSSVGWGEYNNNIQVQLSEGSAPNSKKLTVSNWADNSTETYDNIGPIFEVGYKGSSSTMSLSIVRSQSGVKTLTLNDGDTDVLSYRLGRGEFEDVNKLVYHINEHVDFEANMVTYGNKNINSDQLDEIANIDISENGYTVTAMKGDLVHQTRFSNLIEVVLQVGEFPENFEYTELAGGTDGAPSASWAEALTLLHGEGVTMIVPLTGDEAIHAEVARFVQSQSENEKNPTIAFYGGRSGESIDDTISRAYTLNSSRAVQCYPGITVASEGGGTKELASYFTAAMIAGRVAGKETGDPITLDYLALIGLERVLRATEIERLIGAGITTIEFVRQTNRRGYRIVQGLTTYQADSNPSYKEISMRLVSDELIVELNEHLENRFAGGRGTVTTVSLIKNETQSFLDRKVREDVIVDYDPNSVEAILDGDTVHVKYRAIPVGAINYILITAKYYREQILA